MVRRSCRIALLVFPALAMAAPPSSDVRALQQQIAALQLDHALNLTQQQAQALLPILQNAKARRQAFQAQRATNEPALVAALTQAVADLKATSAISTTTQQAVDAARSSPATLRADLRASWEQAREILTADQLQVVRTLRLGVPPASSSPEHGRGAVRAHRFRLMRTFLSDAFVALSQARAG